MLRFNLDLFPEASRYFADAIMLLAVVGIIYGAIVAMMQTDIKRLIAYSSVSHMGLIVLGIFAFSAESMDGAVLQMVNHGLSTGMLFLVFGMLYERTHTREIADLGGIVQVTPWLAGAYVVAMLSSIGLPGLNNFVGEFLVLLGHLLGRPGAGVDRRSIGVILSRDLHALVVSAHVPGPAEGTVGVAAGSLVARRRDRRADRRRDAVDRPASGAGARAASARPPKRCPDGSPPSGSSAPRSRLPPRGALRDRSAARGAMGDPARAVPVRRSARRAARRGLRPPRRSGAVPARSRSPCSPRRRVGALAVGSRAGHRARGHGERRSPRGDLDARALRHRRVRGIPGLPLLRTRREPAQRVLRAAALRARGHGAARGRRRSHRGLPRDRGALALAVRDDARSRSDEARPRPR